MRGKCVAVFLALGLAFGTTSAWATYMADITYDFADNGGGDYVFTFEVSNTSTDGDTEALDFFWIDFTADDLAAYSAITWVADNGWAAGAFEPDPAFGGLPGAAFADDASVFGGGGGLSQGGILGGFAVSFNYTGLVAPEAQLFDWYAAFGTFDDGSTTADVFGTTRYVPSGDDGSVPVPEPGTLALLGSGLVALCGRRRFPRLDGVGGSKK